MRRREVTVGLLAATAWQASRPTLAQTPKPLRLGILTLNPRDAPHWIAFEKRLREHGFADCDECQIRFVELRAGSQPAVAMRSLMEAGIDIVIASGPEEVLKGTTDSSRGVGRARECSFFLS